MKSAGNDERELTNKLMRGSLYSENNYRAYKRDRGAGTKNP